MLDAQRTMTHLLSLGAGVQSSTLALMAAAGEVTPMPTAAIFSDTQAEPDSVYRWLDWLEKQLPFPVYRVTHGSLTEAALATRTNQKTGGAYYKNMIPVFTLNGDGSPGQVSRHCTSDYKIHPIISKARSLVGAAAMRQWRAAHRPELQTLAALAQEHKGNKKRHSIIARSPAFRACQDDALVIQWIGISLDELIRQKPSRDPWCQCRWPLIEKRMTRHLCLQWMRAKGYPEPPRSACVYCPYHSNAEWRRLKDDEPESFAEAVRFERELQTLHSSISANGKINGTPFLHTDRKPLDQVDLSNDADRGQQLLWQDECEGMCGV